MARVVLENVTKTFQGPRKETVYAVRNASVAIEDQEFLVLVGPSGCGKSTLLRLISGLEEISEGTISIDGRIVNHVAPKDRDIAMVFQNYALYPHMTVYENLAFGLKLRKFPKDEIERRVREAAEMLGLTDLMNRLPKALSGGQRQRVAVGRAIVRKPKVFLFDEPLSNLDAKMRVQMRMEISKLHLRLASTMLYVTHDQTEAMTMGDRIAVMRDGTIQQIADPLTLYESPANLFVAGFIGTPPMSFFPGRLTALGSRFFFEADPPNPSIRFRIPPSRSAALAPHADRPVVCGIRPEDFHESPPAGSSTANSESAAVQGTVEMIEPMGSETYLHLSSGTQLWRARVSPEFRTALGQAVTLHCDLRKAHFFDPATEKAL